ncbi:hypothetical protein MTO96_001334 [Rhipicephalus appendiculatus]
MNTNCKWCGVPLLICLTGLAVMHSWTKDELMTEEAFLKGQPSSNLALLWKNCGCALELKSQGCSKPEQGGKRERPEKTAAPVGALGVHERSWPHRCSASMHFERSSCRQRIEPETPAVRNFRI